MLKTILLSTGDFEGIIALGNYGAGTVMVWDAGNTRKYRESGEGFLQRQFTFLGEG